MNRFDIVQDKEPEEERPKPLFSSKPDRFEPFKLYSSVYKKRSLYLRREGGEEIKIFVEDINMSSVATPTGPEMSVTITFSLTKQDSKKLMG